MIKNVFFWIGAFLLMLPFLLQFLDAKSQENVISTYWEEIEALEKSELEECILEAKEYNQQLFEATKAVEREYQELLDLSNNGIMGTIEIPRISLKLPIYHGTTEEVLSKGIGHLKESSLPVGGENVHSVLTGHRGLPNAQLFTRLDELEEKDIFFVRICNEVFTYQVKEIRVVKPEEVDILEIRSEMDLVSLITCTPYGLNTHRLVVTGERVEELEAENIEEITKKNPISIRALLLLLIIVIFALIAVVRNVIGRKRKCTLKQWMMLLMILLLCVPMNSLAKEGTVEIVIPDHNQKQIEYAKVGDIKKDLFVLKEEYARSGIDLNSLETAREIQEAAKRLNAMLKETVLIEKSGNTNTIISDLEEGVYLFRIKEKYGWNPILIYIPTQIESDKERIYNITIIPKYGENMDTPETGWEDYSEYYFSLILFAGVFIVQTLRKNRL